MCLISRPRPRTTPYTSRRTYTATVPFFTTTTTTTTTLPLPATPIDPGRSTKKKHLQLIYILLFSLPPSHPPQTNTTTLSSTARVNLLRRRLLQTQHTAQRRARRVSHSHRPSSCSCSQSVGQPTRDQVLRFFATTPQRKKPTARPCHTTGNDSEAQGQSETTGREGSTFQVVCVARPRPLRDQREQEARPSSSIRSGESVLAYL